MSSLAEEAYEIIKHDIITCALEPGQKIVQSALADRYGLGTTPIREALHRLAQDHLVEPVPRVGYIVSPVTIADVREIFELRYVLESATVRLAATRADQDHLKEILSTAHFTYTYRDRQSYIEFLSRNADFHRKIAEAAGNGRLVSSISQILDELTRVFHLGLDIKDSAAEMKHEHVALAEALCDRDAERAAGIVQDQIERSQERILQALIHRRQNLSEILKDDARVEVMSMPAEAHQ
jgi:DNA-binding GntR family transcriptional regulator